MEETIDIASRAVELQDLPFEILENIIQNLNVSDILSLAEFNEYFAQFLPHKEWYEYYGYPIEDKDYDEEDEYEEDEYEEDEYEEENYENQTCNGQTCDDEYYGNKEGCVDDEDLQHSIDEQITKDFNSLFPIQEDLHP